MRNYQTVLPLFTLAGLPASSIQSGALKAFDINGDEILSQATIVSGNSSDEEEDSLLVAASDDETVGNLDLSNEEDQNQQQSFRSRSTIY